MEGAARRLARTLAAPEFRDLEARRGAAAAYVADLDRRLRHGSRRERGGASCSGRRIRRRWRTCRCGPCATISPPPPRRWKRSCGVLGGGVPAATATATARYDEGRGRDRAGRCGTSSPGLPACVCSDSRRAPSGAPRRAARPLALDVRGGERGAAPGAARRLAGARAGAPRGVTVVATWTEPATVQPIRATLRPITFGRLAVAPPARERRRARDGRPGRSPGASSAAGRAPAAAVASRG